MKIAKVIVEYAIDCQVCSFLLDRIDIICKKYNIHYVKVLVSGKSRFPLSQTNMLQPSLNNEFFDELNENEVMSALFSRTLIKTPRIIIELTNKKRIIIEGMNKKVLENFEEIIKGLIQ